MRQYFKFLFTFINLLLASQSKADSWIDPTWKEMLDSSSVIALVQYSSAGDFRAKAKILFVYKGQLKTNEEIWISGFSNRYGPIDKVNKGDKYLVFLKLSIPTDKRLEYWNEEAIKDPSIKGYVEAFKDNRAYFVWSPTSGDLKIDGDKIQYDLTTTTQYRNQDYFSLQEFETFLNAYIDKRIVHTFCKKLISQAKSIKEDNLNAQWLMMLFLLGYNQYDPLYENYIGVKNTASRYALAQLMGNIRTEQSKNILIILLSDPHSLVQSEAVRQLKHEPAEVIGPILLKHLKSSSDVNFGPSNIMDPVMNSINGGKAEIITALGELKYKPAIPDLLLLLDTDDRYVFKLVIESIKKMDSKDYVHYLNKHLDNKTDDLIFDISMMISDDSLVECLPNLKNFISTCNRNTHPSYDYTISTCCGIGHFQDSSTISFLLYDYKHFFTYKDTLQSRKQQDWTNEYIETFTDLKLKEARPLIYKSLYDWFGFDQNFGVYPKLFGLKKHFEDSLRQIFKKKLGNKGYTLNSCIAFIQNTDDVVAGKLPKVDYMVEITIPSTGKMGPHQELIITELNLNEKNIYLRSREGWYYIEQQQRFDKSLSSTPFEYFLKFVSAVPDKNDFYFLQALIDHNFINDKYYQKEAKKTVEQIKTQLKL